MWREDLVLSACAALERAFGGYCLTEPLRERSASGPVPAAGPGDNGE